jgi:hypothetical protein
MSELRRLGEIINLNSDFHNGEKRIIRGLDNLSGRVLFPEESHGIKEFYISSTPLKKIQLSNSFKEIEIGDYEGSILDKILTPIDPVVCIKGRMGSGKSTTIRYVMENYVDKVENEELILNGLLVTRLTTWVDFSHLVTEKETTLHDLLKHICTQLWNKCISHFDDEFEYKLFWEHLQKNNEFFQDDFVDQVVGIIHNEYPEIRDVVLINEEEIKKRKEIKRGIIRSNLIWHLRYLILLYRFIIQTKFSDHKEYATIILDNVDSLSTELQRNLVRIIIGCAHKQGPTFVILVRPETFERNGLNDLLQDVVLHQSPAAHLIILDRLERFIQNPEKYFHSAQTLTSEEKTLVISYLKYIFPKLKLGRSFHDFVKFVSGKNIRNALVLAQSIFSLKIMEMKRRDLTENYIVRSMIRFGMPQYRSYQNPRISNPFELEGITDGRFLTKIRLLKYIAGRGGSSHTPTIISTFSMFNSLDFIGKKNDAVTIALEELLKNDCQLLTSNGFDAFHITPDDDQDEISITEIGKYYIDHLIYDINFITEVMLDARVDSDFTIPSQYADPLSNKIFIMIKFFEKIYESEIKEIHTFMDKGIADYAKIFQPRLISYDIISRTYNNTYKLLTSTKLVKRTDRILEYEDVLYHFNELLKKVNLHNIRLFGVIGGTTPEPE